MSTITSQVKTYIDPVCCSNVTKARKGEVIITEISKNSESSCKSIVWIGDEDVVTSQQCLIATPDNEKIDGEYLAYFFNSNSFLKQKCSFIDGSSIFHINTSDIEKILIPLPPLEIQRAIADFLQQIENPVQYTKYGLSEELSLRKEQLNAYLSKLTQRHRSTAKHVKLEDVASYISDKINTEELNTSNYISVENLLQDIEGKVESANVPEKQIVNAYKEQDILLGNIRPYLHKIWFATHAGGCNQDVLIIRPHSPAILPKYLFFVLCAPEFWLHNESFTRTGALVRGDKQKIMHYEFPLPSIEEQEKAVNLLDKLHELTFFGVAKELNLRKRQFEAYSHSLLALYPSGELNTQNNLLQSVKELDKIPLYSVGDLCTIKLGNPILDQKYLRTNHGPYPVYTGSTNGAQGYIDTYDYDGEYVTYIYSSAGCGETYYRNEKFSINKACHVMQVKDKSLLDTRYLAYIFNIVCKKYINPANGMAKLNSSTTAKIQIPVPPMHIQVQIADLLQTIENLISNKECVLEKKPQPRTKQFEAYLDKFF